MNEKKDRGKQTGKKQAKQSVKGRWIFLGISALLYLAVLVVNRPKAVEVGAHFLHLTGEVLPFLLVVFAIMVLINLFLKTEILVRYMGEGSGLKGWLIAIITGILSVGAIYLWFPILKNMMEKGVKPGLVAVFLYNRGIKLHWLPLMAFYFGMKYVVVLTLVTVLVSVLQGWILNLLTGKSKTMEEMH